MSGLLFSSCPRSEQEAILMTQQTKAKVNRKSVGALVWTCYGKVWCASKLTWSVFYLALEAEWTECCVVWHWRLQSHCLSNFLSGKGDHNIAELNLCSQGSLCLRQRHKLTKDNLKTECLIVKDQTGWKWWHSSFNAPMALQIVTIKISIHYFSNCIGHRTKTAVC